ncbi:MAG: hypothetical protein ACI8Q9_001581, partial [Planctomycetota bacterium]
TAAARLGLLELLEEQDEATRSVTRPKEIVVFFMMKSCDLA